MSFLDEIRPKIEEQVESRKQEHPPDELKRNLQRANHAFRKAIEDPDDLSLIAEFKRSSPSGGDINQEAPLSRYARLYDRYADALSILTEPAYFSGSPSLLRNAQSHTDRPLLRKDFIIDPYQIFEARFFGADAVLLIENMLSDEELRTFIEQVEELGMDALVECHDSSGLRRVLDAGAEIIGVNNRDLQELTVDRRNTNRLIKALSDTERAGRLFVAESGLHTRSHVLDVEDVADAVLIGSAIMSAPVPEVKLRELTGQTLVKFCGITGREDARRAVDLGVDMVGLNFYDPSPRAIEPDTAVDIADDVRGDALIAGVFVDAEPEEIREIVNSVGLDVIQCSGDESPEFINRIRSIGCPIIDAVQIKDHESLQDVYRSPAEYQMVDAFDEERHGGTGKRLNDDLLERSDLDVRRLVVAGGITPDNVSEIQRRLQPLMVDVCSGIETEPGRKEPDAMRAFMDAVREGRTR